MRRYKFAFISFLTAMKIFHNKKDSQSESASKFVLMNRVIPSLIFLIVFLLAHFFVKKNGDIYDVYHWFFLYLSLLVISPILANIRFIKYIYYAIQLPAAIILLLAPYINAVGTIIFIYVMVLGAAVVFFGVLPAKLFGLNLQEGASVYLILTAVSIVVTTSGDRLVRLWHHIYEEEENMERQNKLSLSILNQKRSKFVVFVIYFLLIIVFTFCNLNNIKLFEASKIDTAILQSFATFIAFDRLISNKGLLKEKLPN